MEFLLDFFSLVRIAIAFSLVVFLSYMMVLLNTYAVDQMEIKHGWRRSYTMPIVFCFWLLVAWLAW